MFEHLEPIWDATKASLRGQLPARIAEINALHDDFQLDVPDNDSYFVGGWTALNYPMVEIASPDFSMYGWSIQQVGVDVAFPVAVRLMFEDRAIEPERILRKAARYSTAILRVLAVPGAFGNALIDKDRGMRGGYAFNPETDQREEGIGTVLHVYTLLTAETRI